MFLTAIFIRGKKISMLYTKGMVNKLQKTNQLKYYANIE